jgi:hypothetical protein
LNYFLASLQLGTEHEEKLKYLKRKFVVVTILFRKYEKLFESLFESPSMEDRISSTKNVSFFAFSFGWTLFLVAKGWSFVNKAELKVTDSVFFFLVIACRKTNQRLYRSCCVVPPASLLLRLPYRTHTHSVQKVCLDR